MLIERLIMASGSRNSFGKRRSGGRMTISQKARSLTNVLLTALLVCLWAFQVQAFAAVSVESMHVHAVECAGENQHAAMGHAGAVAEAMAVDDGHCETSPPTAADQACKLHCTPVQATPVISLDIDRVVPERLSPGLARALVPFDGGRLARPPRPI